MRFLILILLLARIAILPMRAADSYVSNVASGANDGSSWANAWSPTSVNWSTVMSRSGILYVDGGSGELIYTNNLLIGEGGVNGTSGKPLIARHGGQSPSPSGHNGNAIWDRAVITMADSRPDWVYIDGGKSASFVAPTNFAQIRTLGMTNNIGFIQRNIFGTLDSDTSPTTLFLRRPTNIRVEWVEYYNITNTGSYEFHETRGTAGAYIDAGDEGGAPLTNNWFRYLYLHDNAGQQFSLIANTPTGFDDIVWDFVWIDLGGEDFFEIGGGTTIRNSIIGPAFPNGVHEDHFQLTGDYIKIYNNEINEACNSLLRIQTFPDPASHGLRHSIFFYNNIVTEKPGRAPGGGTLVEPICIVHFDPAHPCNEITLSNIWFANNLFYLSITNTGQGFGEMARNGLMYWHRGGVGVVTNGYVLASGFVNNLVLDKHRGTGFPVSVAVDPEAGYTGVSTNNFKWRRNRHAAVENWLLNPTFVTFIDTATNVNNHPYKLDNSEDYPIFVDKANYNFELAANDTAALGQGLDLSGSEIGFSFDYDALNRPRTTWDIGPLAFQGFSYTPPDRVTNGLKLLLSFDDLTSSTNLYLTDSSGRGNNAYRFGFPDDPAAPLYTNFPWSVSAATNSGRTLAQGSNGYAGKFDWFPNASYGIYQRVGLYAGITNIADFTNKTQFSVMCWVRYRAPHSGLDYSSDANGTLMEAGLSGGDLGGWLLGRYNNDIFLNNTRLVINTNQGGFGQIKLEFPDNGFTNDGDTLVWNHYCFTFDSGTVKLYYNGSLYSTTVVPGVTALTVGHSTVRPYDYLSLGCAGHVGTPMLDDESPFGDPAGDYPNNGFFNGDMDDFRIYDLAITATEISAIYNGTLYTGEPSSGSSSPALGITGRMVIAGGGLSIR